MGSLSFSSIIVSVGVGSGSGTGFFVGISVSFCLVGESDGGEVGMGVGNGVTSLFCDNDGGAVVVT